MNNIKGLTSNEVQENIKKYGLNILKKEKNKSLFKIIIEQLKDSTIYLLLVAGILSFILKEYLDSIIIFIVLIINTIIGAFQEFKAEKALEELKKISSPMCKVLRDDKLINIEVDKITVGDIIYLEEGDIVPADLVLLESNYLKIDESLLTGESNPIIKDYKYQEKKNENIGDKLNRAYSSTTIISGNGIGKVVAIGMETEVGKIANLLNDEEGPTPLQLKLDKVSRFLGIFTIGLALLVFIIGLMLSFDSLEILIFSISLAVAAIPEGLPAVITIVLSLGVKKMVKKKAIVRKLIAVETLGSIEIICTDKTGTITKNELEVKEIYSFNNKELFNAFKLCNNVKDGIGDPLEVALLDYLKNNGLFRENSNIRIKEYPFTSERKMMSVLIKNNIETLYSKGALEAILDKCQYYSKDKQILHLDDGTLNLILNKARELENKSYRVLAFAYKEEDVEEGLIFLGLVGFYDPPREKIDESIKLLKRAGIQTYMITGDHKNTAFQIAKEVGIATNIDQCINGDELDVLLLENKPIDQYHVFSRVNPSHKAKIVDYYKNKNKVVAMTGDGVNDAPALKKADVGIAMGNGSEVSKSSSDIVLLDNNFRTIEQSVEEGRNIFLNIKKAVLFLLSSNLGEVLSVLVFLLLRLPIPLLSIHILWINLISDSLPSLALGNDDKYDDVMNDKPRGKNESLFQKNGMFIIIFYGILIFLITSISFIILPLIRLYELDMNMNISNLNHVLLDDELLIKSRTYAFTTLGMSQLFHMIGMSNIKEKLINIFKNRNILRIVSIVSGFLLQIAVTEIPFLIETFKTSKLTLKEWIWLVLMSSIPLIFQQIYRKCYKTGL